MTIPICQHITLIKVVCCDVCKNEIRYDMKDYDKLSKITTKGCDYYLMPCPHCNEIVALDVKRIYGIS